MKNLFWAMLSATALVCACSTISKKQTLEAFPFPPVAVEGSEPEPVAIDAQLEKALRASPTEPMRFLVRYRQAKLWSPIDPAKACGLWLGITDNPRFPLNRVARLRAVETCAPTRPEIAGFNESLSQNQESWLREASVRAGLARAVRAGDKAQELRYALEVAPFETVQKDQLRLLERARSLAKELGDSSSEERTLSQLQKLAPRYIPAPSPEQFMMVAADFRRARDYDKARQFYKKVFERTELTDFERLRALDGIRMTYKLESQKQKFLTATREYSDFARTRFFKAKSSAGTPAQTKAAGLAKYLETRLTLARAIWTENSPTEAQSILKKLEGELRGRYPVEESMFLRARIEEEAGRLEKSVSLLENIDESRIPDRATRHKVRWYRAWNYRKVGRMKDAAVLLAKLAADEEATPLIARNRFWLGRTLKDAGEKEKAASEFTWLTVNDPIGYYGMMAYRELGLAMPALGPSPIPGATIVADSRAPAEAVTAPPANAQTIAPDPGLALAPEERLTFEWLVATTELDLAKRFLDQLGVVRRQSMSDAQLLDYLQLYARAGAYQSLFSRMSELPAETRKAILDKNPELIFPRPWSAIVEKAGARFDVKPQLVFSIIRQESSFSPTARSGADAFGLMQLLPEVARASAGPLGVNVLSHEDLYKPETNITLGTAHLKELFKRWDDHFIPAVASYNASERAVQGWLKSRDRRDTLAFIEDIPYEETKGYVKLVMRNFVFYSRLTSNGQAFVFPEWCLAGIQDAKL